MKRLPSQSGTASLIAQMGGSEKVANVASTSPCPARYATHCNSIRFSQETGEELAIRYPGDLDIDS
jgi:hypothetical protein